MAPPSSRRSPWPLWIGAAVVIGVVVIGGAWFLGIIPGSQPAPTASPSQSAGPTFDNSQLAPPEATPLASPPAEPAGDGTTATIETELGNVVFELYNESSPVAAENFINLAEAGYYDGVIFHRTIPEFMIQGGDPLGTGTGGPGYTIPDEPIVGEYLRGTVAMARTSAPNSQGSQFFIMVADRPDLASAGDYAIFGNVIEGLDVVDQIVARETDPTDDRPLEPVVMDRVTIQAP